MRPTAVTVKLQTGLLKIDAKDASFHGTERMYCPVPRVRDSG